MAECGALGVPIFAVSGVLDVSGDEVGEESAQPRTRGAPSPTLLASRQFGDKPAAGSG